MTLPLENAVCLGVLLSLTLYLRRTSQPRLQKLFPVPGMVRPVFALQASAGFAHPRLKIVRLNGSLYFGAIGGGLYLFNPKQDALGMLQRSGQRQEIGAESGVRLGAHLIGSTMGPIATCAMGAKSFKAWQ